MGEILPFWTYLWSNTSVVVPVVIAVIVNVVIVTSVDLTFFWGVVGES